MAHEFNPFTGKLDIVSTKWRYCYVNGSNVTTTSTTLVAITGLSLALRANVTYEVEAVLFTKTSSDNTGIKYGINYSQAGASVLATINGSRNGITSATDNWEAFNTQSFTFMILTDQDGSMIIKGIVTVGANAGDLTLQHAKVTSGTSTVYPGSYMKVRPIPAND